MTTTPDDDGVIGDLKSAEESIKQANERVRTGKLSIGLFFFISPIVGSIYGLLSALVGAAWKSVNQGRQDERDGDSQPRSSKPCYRCRQALSGADGRGHCGRCSCCPGK